MRSTKTLFTLKRLFSNIKPLLLSNNSLLLKRFSSKALSVQTSYWKPVIGFGASLYGAYALYYTLHDEVQALNHSGPGEPNPSLPWYSYAEVQTHAQMSSRVWVVFRQGVYDITEFVQMHPGGEIILKAAGGSIEPFWEMYGVHMNEDVFDLLETYRIGNITVEESKRGAQDKMADPYIMEPPRSPLLTPTSLKPFNAEPPPAILVENFLTPADVFYVRNHLPVPVVTEDSYRLHIEAKNLQGVPLTLEQIKELPSVTVTAAVMCAGNRRSEMSEVRPVKGLTWGHAAVGNAAWTGVRLRDVLRRAGLPETAIDDETVHHVHFEGLDTDIAKVPYAASVPATKALDPRQDVILAYEMNGKPLSPDHGYPLRAIVPGVVGARNVKWLGKIILSDKESTSHWQQNDYKGFSPSTDWDSVDFSKSPAIQELPVISAICKPAAGEPVKLKERTIEVEGYAWSGGGKAIVRVDVTADQGKTWHVANFTARDTLAPLTRHYGWTLWKVSIPVDPGTKEVEIWSKAVDASYNTQPETFSNIWNLRGVLANAYHRVKVPVS